MSLAIHKDAGKEKTGTGDLGVWNLNQTGKNWKVEDLKCGVVCSTVPSGAGGWVPLVGLLEIPIAIYMYLSPQQSYHETLLEYLSILNILVILQMLFHLILIMVCGIGMNTLPMLETWNSSFITQQWSERSYCEVRLWILSDITDLLCPNTCSLHEYLLGMQQKPMGLYTIWSQSLKVF